LAVYNWYRTVSYLGTLISSHLRMISSQFPKRASNMRYCVIN
jgi:hypothetical protein